MYFKSLLVETWAPPTYCCCCVPPHASKPPLVAWASRGSLSACWSLLNESIYLKQSVCVFMGNIKIRNHFIVCPSQPPSVFVSQQWQPLPPPYVLSPNNSTCSQLTAQNVVLKKVLLNCTWNLCIPTFSNTHFSKNVRENYLMYVHSSLISQDSDDSFPMYVICIIRRCYLIQFLPLKNFCKNWMQI